MTVTCPSSSRSERFCAPMGAQKMVFVPSKEGFAVLSYGKVVSQVQDEHHSGPFLLLFSVNLGCDFAGKEHVTTEVLLRMLTGSLTV